LSRRVPSEFFTQHPVDCARGLIGAELVCGDCSGIVVETEAYCAVGDEAAHTFVRPKAREFVDEYGPGTAYVYLNYGMYWLANVLVKGREPGFVLLRALEPVRGIEAMKARREREKVTDLCTGPGKLTIALGIDGSHHGDSFTSRGAPFYFRDPREDLEVESDRRVGISKAVDLPWRFLSGQSPFVSVKAPAPPHRGSRKTKKGR
jgi:DNA-3-methyladenine glycosylase